MRDRTTHQHFFLASLQHMLFHSVPTPSHIPAAGGTLKNLDHCIHVLCVDSETFYLQYTINILTYVSGPVVGPSDKRAILYCALRKCGSRGFPAPAAPARKLRAYQLACDDVMAILDNVN